MEIFMPIIALIIQVVIWGLIAKFIMGITKGKKPGLPTIQNKVMKRKTSGAKEVTDASKSIRTTNDEMLKYSRVASNISDLEKENWVRD